MLELIAAIGLFIFIVKHERAHERAHAHKASTIPAKPAARKRKMRYRAGVKPSGKRILGAIVEHKIGPYVMPHGYCYPRPFNQHWVNVFCAFNKPE